MFSSGNRYSGAFSRGLLHGHGQHMWPDGLCYTGDFQANKATGQGVSRSRLQKHNTHTDKPAAALCRQSGAALLTLCLSTAA